MSFILFPLSKSAFCSPAFLLRKLGRRLPAIASLVPHALSAEARVLDHWSRFPPNDDHQYHQHHQHHHEPQISGSIEKKLA